MSLRMQRKVYGAFVLVVSVRVKWSLYFDSIVWMYFAHSLGRSCVWLVRRSQLPTFIDYDEITKTREIQLSERMNDTIRCYCLCYEMNSGWWWRHLLLKRRKHFNSKSKKCWGFSKSMHLPVYNVNVRMMTMMFNNQMKNRSFRNKIVED